MCRKSWQVFAIALLSVGLLLPVTGCQENSQMTGPLSDNGSDIASLLVSDPEAEPSDVTDASVEQDMIMSPPSSDRGGFRGSVFGQMDLTDEQKEAIREAAAAKKECAKEIIAELRASEKEYFEAARAARAEVLADLEAGEITREEARAAIKEIMQNLRETLANNPARAEAKEALEGCKEAFDAAMQEILTEEQYAAWQEWKENHKKDRERRRKHGRRG